MVIVSLILKMRGVKEQREDYERIVEKVQSLVLTNLFFMWDLSKKGPFVKSIFVCHGTKFH